MNCLRVDRHNGDTKSGTIRSADQEVHDRGPIAKHIARARVGEKRRVRLDAAGRVGDNGSTVAERIEHGADRGSSRGERFIDQDTSSEDSTHVLH